MWTYFLREDEYDEPISGGSFDDKKFSIFEGLIQEESLFWIQAYIVPSKCGIASYVKF